MHTPAIFVCSESIFCSPGKCISVFLWNSPLTTASEVHAIHRRLKCSKSAYFSCQSWHQFNSPLIQRSSILRLSLALIAKRRSPSAMVIGLAEHEACRCWWPSGQGMGRAYLAKLSLEPHCLWTIHYTSHRFHCFTWANFCCISVTGRSKDSWFLDGFRVVWNPKLKLMLLKSRLF